MAAQKSKNTAAQTAEVTDTTTFEIERTEEKAEPKKPLIPKDVDPHQYITVKNGFHGKLIYKSARTGETFTWDTFGSEQEIELHELRNAKNASKAFFINNWFMFDEEWVVEYLGVRNFYKNSISIDRFDDIFENDPAEIKSIVSGMSDGQRKSLAYRAKELIRDEIIDSRKVISALEESLGIQLIER